MPSSAYSYAFLGSSADRLEAVAVRVGISPAVAAETLVAAHPGPGKDRRGKRDLASEGVPAQISASFLAVPLR